MYRPEGWDGYEGAHNALRDNNPWLEDEHTACYEAGADAMLERLKKDCNKHFSGWVQKEGVERYNFEVKQGLWVFIPEGE